MSDRMDWIIPSGVDNPVWIIPAAVWSTSVVFQFGSMIREWWINRETRQQRRRSEMSDWTKIRRGEVKRGFRLWLEPRCCPYSRVRCHYYVATQLASNDNDWNERVHEDTASVFMVMQHRMPNNADQSAKVLRRYSIFSPNVYTDIAQVVNQHGPMGSGWKVLKSAQLDDRTVAMMFKRGSLVRVRAILIDVEEKSSRLVEMTSPLGIHEILFMCRDEERKNRLRIVYGKQQWNLREMITVDYEIRESNANPSRLIACEVASQSISIPGRRKCVQLVIPGTHYLESVHPNEQSFVFKFDHRGNYQGDSFDVWRQRFEASVLGRQLDKAVDDLLALSPEVLSRGASGYLFRGGLLHLKFLDVHSPNPAWSIVQRRLKVPSMKSLAAEAICRARPMADLSMIKAETGVDIFDGIFENREKPMPTISLIPDD